MDPCSMNHTAKTTLQGCPDESTLHTVRDSVKGLAFGFDLLLGLPTNSYILWLILSGGREKIVSDFVPLNQIVVEILHCLSGIWYFLDRYLPHILFKKLLYLFSSTYIIIRPLVQSLVCLEQYLGVVHPVKFHRHKPLKYRVIFCCVSWLTVDTLSIVGTVFDFQFFLFLLIGIFFFSLLLFMGYCCFSVLRALKRPGPGMAQRGQHRGNKMKRRAFNLILFNLVNTTVSQLPLTIIVSLNGYISELLFLTLGSINTIIFVITGFAPSILYLSREKKLHCKCKCI